MSTLFLKYRPQSFTDLIGQDAITRTLKNAIKVDKPSHAYLFSGSRGTGKTSSARIFAKALNCDVLVDGNPCSICKTCKDIAGGDLIDVVEIDAASHTGVENIRQIIEKLDFAPTYAKRKVYIIDEVHMLSKGAFNALLKTLEEPPDHVYFLLATTEMHKIPETIVSRCQTFIFHRFSIDQLTGRLQTICEAENFMAEKGALDCIARKAEGGLRDAISLLEQISAETECQITEKSVMESLGIASCEILEKFWGAIQNKQVEEGLKVLHEISEAGGDFRNFGHDFLGFLRTQLHQNLGNSKALSQILPAVEEIEKALARLKTSPIIELPLEIAVINLCMKSSVEQSTSIPKQGVVVSASKKTVVASSFSSKPVSEKSKPEVVFEKSPIQEEKVERVHVPIKDVVPQNLSSDKIQSQMETIAKNSGIPVFAKRSFLSCTPRVDGTNVIFETDSEFHREKLIPTSVSAPIQKSLSESFGGEVTVEFKRNDSVKPKTKTQAATVDDFLSF